MVRSHPLTLTATRGFLAMATVKSSGLTPRQQFPSEYTSWKCMRRRCSNKKEAEYWRYGGSGVTICEAWMESFANFLSDMGPKPTAMHTIDRMNPALGYCKANCRWATRKEQQATRHDSFLANGVHVPRIAEQHGICRGTLRGRLERGESLESALARPIASRARYLTLNGRTQRLQDWCRELGIHSATLLERLNSPAWTLERALTTPKTK